MTFFHNIICYHFIWMSAIISLSLSEDSYIHFCFIFYIRILYFLINMICMYFLINLCNSDVVLQFLHLLTWFSTSYCFGWSLLFLYSIVYSRDSTHYLYTQYTVHIISLSLTHTHTHTHYTYSFILIYFSRTYFHDKIICWFDKNNYWVKFCSLISLIVITFDLLLLRRPYNWRGCQLDPWSGKRHQPHSPSCTRMWPQNLSRRWRFYQRSLLGWTVSLLPLSVLITNSNFIRDQFIAERERERERIIDYMNMILNSIVWQRHHGRSEIGNRDCEECRVADVRGGARERRSGRRASCRRALCDWPAAWLLDGRCRVRSRRLEGELSRAARRRILHTRCAQDPVNIVVHVLIRKLSVLSFHSKI